MEASSRRQVGGAGRAGARGGAPGRSRQRPRAGARGRSLEQLAVPRRRLRCRSSRSWPRGRARPSWGEWLDAFTRLAPRVLRSPAPVLRVLADLRPMADVGPIDLDEARRVLSERLLTLESEPPARRFGRLFVGTPQQARGRSFRVVFVPGLAERMFPQKPREDPLLLDALRAGADASLATQPRRLAAERLLLQMAAGAASERLYVSYPRIELTESRARVPSFYALDVMRAATGRVPDYEWLEARARVAGNATLAWPAPPDPHEAIDDQEHDLAVLRQLLDEHDREAVKGHAHYLLKLNECLRRSVIDRWARGEPRWSVNDGLTRVSPRYPRSARGAAAHRAPLFALGAAALLRLPVPVRARRDLPAAAARAARAAPAHGSADARQPLSRDPGALLRHAEDACRAAGDRRRRSMPRSACSTRWPMRWPARKYDELAPAVDRVWNDEIASIRRDLHAWLHYLARDGAEWLPRYFEFGFGSVPGERDASSVRDEVTLPGGFKLRGAVDLIEEHRATKVLRVTDHKTGRKPDRIEKVIIGGGAVLQPVLYAMAVEAALRRPGLPRAPVLLHGGRQLLRASDSAQRDDARRRPRGAAGDRPRDRARVPRGDADRRGLRPLRLPAGLRSRRLPPRQPQAAGQACRPRWR